MNRRNIATSLTMVLPLAFTGGCGAFSGDSSLTRVDDLVTWIERVHVESEMSKQKAHSAIDALRAIAATEFRGDPVTAYTELSQTIDTSRTQANALRQAVRTMREAAEPLFDRWSSDLLSFSSPQMRQRSQVRLEETRSRYRAILSAVQPAMTSYDAFNNSIRDVQLFLGHDFNRASVGQIRDDVRALTTMTGELDRRFEASLVAAQDYIDASALPMTAAPSAAPGGAAPRAENQGRTEQRQR